ncbi:MAG: rRNA maturation RNase YbeY [Actinomycetota bacterium]|nr:rRNA maturation RNase YbeY [Actinomycetota bacterium]
MEILVSNQSEVPVNLGLLRDLARYTLLCEGVEPPVELSVALVDQTAIRNLNLKYRGIDEPTDVLSFPLLEETPKTSFPKFLGDVVICPQIAEHQAKNMANPSSRNCVCCWFTAYCTCSATIMRNARKPSL